MLHVKILILDHAFIACYNKYYVSPECWSLHNNPRCELLQSGYSLGCIYFHLQSITTCKLQSSELHLDLGRQKLKKSTATMGFVWIVMDRGVPAQRNGCVENQLNYQKGKMDEKDCHL